MAFFKKLIAFIQATAKDTRIPDRDKAVLAVLVALVISPFDIIPDWIPVIGVLDDVLIIAIVLDYFCNHLDQDILLSHYPWGMKSFVRIRRVARAVAWMAPQWVKRRVWKFKPTVY